MSAKLIAALVLLATCVFAQEEALGPNGQPRPEPYAFSYSADSIGALSSHQESGDGTGRITGVYTIAGPDGRERRVEYVADADGYRATVSTNEIGTQPGDTSDARWQVSQPSAGQLQAAAAAANRPQAFSQQPQQQSLTPQGSAQNSLNQQILPQSVFNPQAFNNLQRPNQPSLIQSNQAINPNGQSQLQQPQQSRNPQDSAQSAQNAQLPSQVPTDSSNSASIAQRPESSSRPSQQQPQQQQTADSNDSESQNAQQVLVNLDEISDAPPQPKAPIIVQTPVSNIQSQIQPQPLFPTQQPQLQITGQPQFWQSGFRGQQELISNFKPARPQAQFVQVPIPSPQVQFVPVPQRQIQQFQIVRPNFGQIIPQAPVTPSIQPIELTAPIQPSRQINNIQQQVQAVQSDDESNNASPKPQQQIAIQSKGQSKGSIVIPNSAPQLQLNLAGPVGEAKFGSKSPSPVSLTSNGPLSPAPLELAPLEPAPLAPAPLQPAPLAPAPINSTPLSQIPESPAVPVAPLPLELSPLTPVRVSNQNKDGVKNSNSQQPLIPSGKGSQQAQIAPLPQTQLSFIPAQIPRQQLQVPQVQVIPVREAEIQVPLFEFDRIKPIQPQSVVLTPQQPISFTTQQQQQPSLVPSFNQLPVQGQSQVSNEGQQQNAGDSQTNSGGSKSGNLDSSSNSGLENNGGSIENGNQQLTGPGQLELIKLNEANQPNDNGNAQNVSNENDSTKQENNLSNNGNGEQAQAQVEASTPTIPLATPEAQKPSTGSRLVFGKNRFGTPQGKVSGTKSVPFGSRISA